MKPPFHRPLVLSCCLAAGAAMLPAQNLELEVVGGSMPGVFSFDVYPGLYPLELAMIVPSFQPGPTPLALHLDRR